MSDADMTTAQDDPSPEDIENALDPIRHFFASELMRLPPIPRDMVLRLTQVGDAEWSLDPLDSAEPAPRRDLSDPSDFAGRAVDPAQPDALAFGQVGHGVSSWWMCYQLITPSLALFIRQAYGSPYTDAVAARKVLNDAFYDAQSLIVTAEAAAEAGVIPAGERLFVLVDGPERSLWGMTGAPDQWRRAVDAIADAEDSLRS